MPSARAAAVSAASAPCNGCVITRRANRAESRELILAHRRIVHFPERELLDGGRQVLVDADDHVLPESIRACRCAALASMRNLAQPVSTARVMPPWNPLPPMIFHAASAMSWVRRSIM